MKVVVLSIFIVKILIYFKYSLLGSVILLLVVGPGLGQLLFCFALEKFNSIDMEFHILIDLDCILMRLMFL